MKKKFKKILISCVVVILVILFVHIIIPKKSVIKCTASLNNSFDLVKDTNSEIDLVYKKVFLFFRKEDVSTNKITVTFSMDKLNSAENFYYSKNLKEKYCNSEIKENYSCNINKLSDNSYVIEIKTTIPTLVGEKEKMSKKEYIKILKEVGYTCK